MPVPGLSAIDGSGLAVSYLSTQVDANAFVDLGSPGGAVDVTVYIGASAELRATTGNPGLDLTGFGAGTRIRVINKGTIYGHGGAGGRGEEGARCVDGTAQTFFTTRFQGGGGGGGAGFNGGAGGAAVSPATAGLSGTSSAGGTAGLDGVPGGGLTPFVETDGAQPGGDAISVGDLFVEIDNADGFIYGGGGGGSPGIYLWEENGEFPNVTYEAGDGGGLGEDGLPHVKGPDVGSWVVPPPAVWLQPGAAGFAVRGSAVTFLSGGSAPNVLGSVGT